MSEKIEVSSTDIRLFVEDILALGKLGATLPENEGVYKGIVTRTKVEIDSLENVTLTPRMRVIPKDKRNEKLTQVVSTTVLPDGEKYTKDQLEEMSLGEIRKATGLAGSKKEIIKEYLGEAE